MAFPNTRLHVMNDERTMTPIVRKRRDFRARIVLARLYLLMLCKGSQRGIGSHWRRLP